MTKRAGYLGRLRMASVIALGATVAPAAGCGSGDERRRSPAAAPVATIAQPAIVGDLPVATRERRVDLIKPKFTNPTRVTNPFAPR